MLLSIIGARKARNGLRRDGVFGTEILSVDRRDGSTPLDGDVQC
jgi:hypothetical protein